MGLVSRQPHSTSVTARKRTPASSGTQEPDHTHRPIAPGNGSGSPPPWDLDRSGGLCIKRLRDHSWPPQRRGSQARSEPQARAACHPRRPASTNIRAETAHHPAAAARNRPPGRRPAAGGPHSPPGPGMARRALSMEAAGVEPASRDVSIRTSTCVSGLLESRPRVPGRQGSSQTSPELF